MTTAACATVPPGGLDGMVVAINGALSIFNGFSIFLCGAGDDGQGNPLTKLIGCGAGISGIFGFVWVIQFLIGWGEVSELCEGEEDYDELEKVHTYIMVSLIITAILCVCSCVLVAAGAKGGGGYGP